MKSKLYVLIPWPTCQGLDEIEAIKNEIIHPMSEDPSISNSILIPVDLAADYIDGEIINDEFISNDPLPINERHEVEIVILKTGCIVKCANKDLILRAQICIQETFKAATFIDNRGWLHTDKFIVEEEWRKMFKEQFNIGALILKFTSNAQTRQNTSTVN